MFGRPDAGYVAITLGDFHGIAGELTDVAVETLEAFIHGLTEFRPVAVEFDGEGPNYLLVSTAYDTYLVDEQWDDEGASLHHIEIDWRLLALEIVRDIERDFWHWVDWFASGGPNRDLNRPGMIERLLEELKAILRVMPPRFELSAISEKERLRLGLDDEEAYRAFISERNAPVLGADEGSESPDFPMTTT